MITLNLETKTKEHELIKDFLQNNVSETLADKINNGTKFVKEKITLINKKDLVGFWKYAYEEARKLKQDNEQVVGIEDKTVFSWAIHYFEEDSIEGTLYNEDNTLYEPLKQEKPKTENKPKPIIKPPKQEEKKQTSMFDLLAMENEEQETIQEDIVKNIEENIIQEDIENIEDLNQENIVEDNNFIQEETKAILVNDNKIDTETGEILSNSMSNSNDDYITKLITIFGAKIGVEL